MDATLQWDFYLAAGIWQPGCFARNAEIVACMQDMGLKVFLPQEQNKQPCTDRDIFHSNRRGIQGSEAVLFLPDGAGSGVYFELGFANALGKDIYTFGENTDSGKMIRALLQEIPTERKIMDLDDLKIKLASFAKKEII